MYISTGAVTVFSPPPYQGLLPPNGVVGGLGVASGVVIVVGALIMISEVPSRIFGGAALVLVGTVFGGLFTLGGLVVGALFATLGLFLGIRRGLSMM